ncbi:chorismate mutase [Lactococcus lactis]|uniref:chorismate mutase n=1 Tax=Lactococcus lactis TaxID=1358 RepID=UPI001F24CE2E|nr:chorismate mutase [Lactococcus lactis]MCC4121650.1 chorismate mutase [Lactococcus lactis]MCT0044154.1 chorismate mutase [Lactococcus lactis subsp. lactis]
MNKLEELRNNIDQVDQEIVQLLEKRMTIVQEISQEKQAQKITILDNSREQAVLDLARQNIKNSAYQKTIINTFKDIMKNSRLYQRENREQ